MERSLREEILLLKKKKRCLLKITKKMFKCSKLIIKCKIYLTTGEWKK